MGALPCIFDEVADRMREMYEDVVGCVGFHLPVIGGVHERQWERVVKSIAA